MSVSVSEVSEPAPQPGRTGHAGLRFLGWLTWPRVVLLSFLGALLVGAYVYTLVPVNYTSDVSILLSDQPDAITSLLVPAQGKDTGASPGLVGMLGPSSASQRFEQKFGRLVEGGAL